MLGLPRAGSYINRLPLFTRGVLAAIVVFEALCLQRWWDVRAWGALVPEKIGFATRRFSFLLVSSSRHSLLPLDDGAQEAAKEGRLRC
jgi:hypothetical protein